MSIADKLITIAEKLPKVYHAGQLNVLANAESLNGSLSGEAVSANDVIDIEHNIPCQLTSDTVTDFSSVNVSRYGKNLLNQELLLKYFTKQDDGSYSANSVITTADIHRINVNLPPAVYTISVTCNTPEGADYRPIVYYADGTTKSKWYDNPGEWMNMTFTTDGNAIAQVGFTYSSTLKQACLKFRDFQIELGSTQTAFEEYKGEQTTTATADGTVEGITSIAPSMTVLTDTEGVVINANYYKDPDIVISNLAQSVALSGGEG